MTAKRVHTAMILAAGRGERLRPLTDTLPKPLLEAGGKPLIVHHIDKLRDAGITDIVINTAWLDHMIHDAIGEGAAFGVAVRYSDESEALETAGGIIHALSMLGQDPFIVINGDIWCDYDLARLADHALRGDAHLVLVDNPGHNDEGDFAIDTGKLANTGETMHTFSGIGLYSPGMFAGMTGGKTPLAPILRELADAGRITAELYPGHWTDVGTIERLEQLRSELSG